MLGKLMKYEFKATGRVFLPIYAALLIVAAVSRLVSKLGTHLPYIVGSTLTIILMVSVGVITLILTLQRFYKNLLGSEGYLMFTLPVSTDALLWSKLLAATVWFIVSSVVVMLSVLIMALSNVTVRTFWEAIITVFNNSTVHAPDLAGYTAEIIVGGIASIFCSILFLYACMSLSLLVNKHRVLVAFAAYIVITTIAQILAGIVMSLGYASRIQDVFFTLPVTAQVHVGLLGMTGLCLVGSAIFYLITRAMLKHRLNLE